MASISWGTTSIIPTKATNHSLQGYRMNQSLLQNMINLQFNETCGTQRTCTCDETFLRRECKKTTIFLTKFDELIHDSLCFAAANKSVLETCQQFNTSQHAHLEKCECLNKALHSLNEFSRGDYTYNERFIEDFPFCHPFKCPYWVKNGYGKVMKEGCFTALMQCMPSSCKIMFYLFIAIDISIMCAIVVFNITIIVVRVRTTHQYNCYG